jgi:lipase chaperone LimK
MTEKRFLSGFVIVSAAVLIGVGAAWLMRAPDPEGAALQSPAVPTGRMGSVNANPFAKGAYELPATSAAAPDASGEGVFRVDTKGELLLDSDTRTRLDMLLADLPRNATRHEIQAAETAAVAGLPPSAAQKAAAIVEAYVRYLKAETELNEAAGNGITIQPEELFNKFVALRRQHLGVQVADAFFTRQEMQDRVGIQLAMMDANPKLIAQEKIARIDALKRTIPDNAPALHAELETARSAVTMEQSVTALRRNGASEAEVRQLRERHVGAEGAESVSEMEAQKNDWDRKQHAFTQQKDAIAQMNLTEQQKQERIDALLSRIYTEEEIPIARAFHQLPMLR